LKIAESKPPRNTYAATVSDETHMLNEISQPRMIFITRAIEYILMPLIKTVMKPNVIAESARAGSPKRSFKYPGTE
jgi:hypothetical protein